MTSRSTGATRRQGSGPTPGALRRHPVTVALLTALAILATSLATTPAPASASDASQPGEAFLEQYNPELSPELLQCWGGSPGSYRGADSWYPRTEPEGYHPDSACARALAFLESAGCTVVHDERTGSKNLQWDDLLVGPCPVDGDGRPVGPPPASGGGGDPAPPPDDEPEGEPVEGELSWCDFTSESRSAMTCRVTARDPDTPGSGVGVALWAGERGTPGAEQVASMTTIPSASERFGRPSYTNVFLVRITWDPDTPMYAYARDTGPDGAVELQELDGSGATAPHTFVCDGYRLEPPATYAARDLVRQLYVLEHLAASDLMRLSTNQDLCTTVGELAGDVTNPAASTSAPPREAVATAVGAYATTLDATRRARLCFILGIAICDLVLGRPGMPDGAGDPGALPPTGEPVIVNKPPRPEEEDLPPDDDDDGSSRDFAVPRWIGSLVAVLVAIPIALVRGFWWLVRFGAA